MTRVEQFEIVDLAGHRRSIQATLHPDINVIFGLNGTGKTSLLKILAGALSNEAESLYRIPFRTATVDIYSHSAKRSFTCQIERTPSKEIIPDSVMGEVGLVYKAVLVDGVEQYVRQSQERMIWKRTPNPDFSRFLHSFLQTSRLLLTGTREIVRNSQLTDHELDKLFERTIEQEWLTYWGKLQAQLRQVQDQALQRIVDEMMKSKRTSRPKQSTVDISMAHERISSFLRRSNSNSNVPDPNEFALRMESDALFAALINHIQSAENELRDLLKPTNLLQSMLTQMFATKKPVFDPTKILISADDRSLSVSQLSSGEKHLLRILFTAMLNRNQSVLIIDEPELSLHIDWQRILIGALREIAPSSQLIIATHSPEIMSDVPDEKIIQL